MINGETTSYPFGGKMKLHSFKFIFNWRIIALQCCGGLCHTSLWISHNFMYMSSPSWAFPPPFHPSGSSTEHQAELPLLYSSFPLAILHMIVCICQCYFLNLSYPLLPPTVSTCLFCTSTSAFLLCEEVHQYYFLDSIYMC